jgi:hypothetical protein
MERVCALVWARAWLRSPATGKHWGTGLGRLSGKMGRERDSLPMDSMTNLPSARR